MISDQEMEWLHLRDACQTTEAYVETLQETILNLRQSLDECQEQYKDALKMHMG